MNLRHAENYNIGLDIGTGSVGWAVTNENGELYHFKKQPTWGSRLFPSADPAASARTYRGQRRRYDRRRQRLDLLQEFFIDEMEKLDPDFFVRLRQSRLLPEDRAEGTANYRWPLFNASDFTESDYYAKFPTIYHLRVWLMETPEKADLRFVYLALHNIVKVRGNFLHQDNPTLSAKNANMADSIERVCEAVEQWCVERDYACACDSDNIRATLEDTTLSRATKRDATIPLFGMGTEGKPRAKEMAGAILGYIVDFGKVFDITGDGLKFSLGNDEAIDAFYGICPDESLELFEALREAYSAHILLGILKGADGRTISYCKREEYDRYKSDLILLKSLVREYVPTKYDSFFRGAHYADQRWRKDYDPAKAQGYTRYNLGTSKLSYDDFAKDVRKLFKDTQAVADARYIAMDESFKEGTFLRRLKTSDNGSIPYQLHLEEMRAIIENQGKYYPFLLEHQRELESLVTFRIPYYVGPLTLKNAPVKGEGESVKYRFAWSERLPGAENTPIRPWNWDEVIDKDKSAENFIRRMTGTCTYLQGEPVLPRCSLLYEKFCVLNELNGSSWTCDGDKFYRFDADFRLRIYEDLFENAARHALVSYKSVEGWLARNGCPNAHVRGGQGESKYESKLSSYHFFCDVLGVESLSEDAERMVEELILWNTLFEDRDILREKITRAYGDRLNADQIKKICKKRFTGWGRLSKRLLTGLKANTANGPMSIMDILIEGNPEGKHVGSAMVLQEVLHDGNFGFQEIIDQANTKKAELDGGFSLDDLPGSPALRRSINQALRIVDEIVGITGKPPANIFIEVTRDEDERKKGRRTTRRYDGLEAALAELKETGSDILKELKKLSPDQLDDALSLYFMQNAKCMYCGKPLDINQVMSGDHAYQIDHIIPQSYVKDDSFENRVLVHSECNQRKTDALLIDPAIRQKMRGHWGALRDAKLIGEKKFNNLMRDHISEKQMRGFINRQLVETSQIVKHVRLVLAARYPETSVESIKASLSHQLREAQGYVKCREANDFHHAHDALLAAEIGRFIQLRHGKLFDQPIAAQHAMRAFIRSQSEYFKRHHRMPGSASFIVGSFLTSGFDKETGEVFKDAWDAEAECEKIRRYLNYKQCFISRMPEVTSGAFWDANPISPKQGKKALELPLKKGLDPKKYGSFTTGKIAYFFMYAAQDKKGRQKAFFAGVPLYLAGYIGEDKQRLLGYAQSIAPAGFSNVRILRHRINKYQLIEYGNDRYYLPALDVVYSSREIALDQRFMHIVSEIELAQQKNPPVNVPEQDLVDLYWELVHRLSDTCSRFGGIQQTLTINVDGFLEASNQEQQSLILGLLRLIRSARARVDLRLVKGSPNAGGITNGFITNNVEDVVFIDQSVTGMFERRQRLEL